MFPQSIHQSLAALSKVIRGSQLLTPEVQKLASALLNQEVINTLSNKSVMVCGILDPNASTTQRVVQQKTTLYLGD